MTSNSELSGTSIRWQRIVFWAGVPLLIGALNEFALIVALPAIRKDFNLDVADARWLLLSFLIADALVLIVAGRYGDRAGRRRTAIIGLAVIAAGSLGCALMHSFGALLAFRVVEGLGAGIVFSGLLAIITETAPREQIGRAFGIWAVIGAVSVLASPLLGGLLAEQASWRWVFGLNAALSLAAMVAASRILPPMKSDHAAERSSIRLSTVANYVAGTGVISAVYLAMALTWLPLVFLLSVVSDISLIQVGLMFLAYSVWWLVLPPLTGRLADRIGPRRPMALGLVVAAIGLALLSVSADGSDLVMIGAGLALLGIGISFAVPATNAAAMVNVPPEVRGDASGVNMTSRMIGSCFGLLASGYLLTSIDASAIESGARWAWGIAAALLVLAAGVAVVGVRETPTID